jgi:ATP-dependent helicase HrpB
LLLWGLGRQDFGDLPLLDRPEPQAVQRASELLGRLGFGVPGRLTDLGRRALGLPFHPRVASLVLEAPADLRPLALLAALLLEAGGRRASKAEAELPGFDFLAELEDWAQALAPGGRPRGAAEAEFLPELRRGLADGLARLGLPASGGGLLAPAEGREALARRLLRAFPEFVCSRTAAAHFQSFQGLRLEAPKGLGRGTEMLLVLEVAGATRGPGDSALRPARPLRWVPLEPELLLDEVPQWLGDRLDCQWNESKQRVEVFSRLFYGPLLLQETRPARSAWPREAAELLVSRLEARPLTELLDPDQLGQLQGRWLLATSGQWEDREGNGLPELEARLRAHLRRLCGLEDARQGKAGQPHAQSTGAGLAAAPVGLEELQKLQPLASFLASLAPGERRRLEELCPTHIGLPGRKRVPVHYAPGQRPFIESRIQDFFRLAKGPVVGSAGLPLLLHLLAPSNRPVQVTDDLAGFWVRHYPALKKQLQRQYPKHRWPDNPLA